MQFEFFCYFIPTLILYNYAIIFFYKNIRPRGNEVYVINNNRNILSIKIIVFLFCVFGAFGGDWFHYRDEINYLSQFTSMPEQGHLEELYLWVIKNITGRAYLLYRILIWGVALMCYSFALKRLRLDTITTWSLFIVLSVAVSYSVGRGCLGFSLIMLGYSFIIKPGHSKILSYIVGGILLFLSIFCHKSMILFAPVTLMSLVNLNIKRLIVIIIMIPLIIAMLQEFVIMQLATEESMAGKAYFIDEQNNYGLGMSIWQYSYFFIVYSFIGFVCYRIFIKKQQVPQIIRRFFNLTLLLLFEYVVMYFAFTHQRLANDDFAWRVFAFINIPLPIVLSYFFSNRVPRTIYAVFNYALLMADYFILYSAYTNY